MNRGRELEGARGAETFFPFFLLDFLWSKHGMSCHATNCPLQLVAITFKVSWRDERKNLFYISTLIGHQQQQEPPRNVKEGGMNEKRNEMKWKKRKYLFRDARETCYINISGTTLSLSLLNPSSHLSHSIHPLFSLFLALRLLPCFSLSSIAYLLLSLLFFHASH